MKKIFIIIFLIKVLMLPLLTLANGETAKNVVSNQQHWKTNHPIEAKTLFQKGMNHLLDNKFTLAFYDFKIAALLGHKRAQMMMGTMYRYGRGVHKDYRPAYAWYLLAARDTISKDNSKPYDLPEANDIADNATADVAREQLIVLEKEMNAKELSEAKTLSEGINEIIQKIVRDGLFSTEKP